MCQSIIFVLVTQVTAGTQETMQTPSFDSLVLQSGHAHWPQKLAGKKGGRTAMPWRGGRQRTISDGLGPRRRPALLVCSTKKPLVD